MIELSMLWRIEARAAFSAFVYGEPAHACPIARCRWRDDAPTTCPIHLRDLVRRGHRDLRRFAVISGVTG